MGKDLQSARRRLLIFGLTLVLLVAGLAGAARAQSAEERKLALRHFQQAEAYMKTGAYQKAVAEYQAAYQAVAKPGFLFNIGLAYQAAGDKAKAVDNFRRYLKLEPNGRASIEARARADKLTEEIEAEARASADAERQRLEVERRKESARGHAEAAAGHRAAGRYPEAVAELRAAFAAQPDPEYVYQLAEVLRQSGDLAQAVVEYDRYRELAPTGEHAALALRQATELKVKIEEAARPTPQKPAPQEIVVKLPESGSGTGPVAVEKKKKKKGIGWGWVAVGAAALVAGLASDLMPSSARNGELDGTDFVPLSLYGVSGVCVLIGVF